MKFIIHNLNNTSAIELLTDEKCFQSEQDALDLMANVDYQFNSRKIIVHKENVDENFFNLRTGLAGGILQKFTNYKVRLAIVGDFTNYSSKSFRDFMYESNKNKLIMFLPDLDTALKEFES
ncbi:MAG: hypothetical protein A2X64_05920 [Ignavibacteria bacterium GWF2_33_9]|nr:MAG: hypothetical protein A2X64_05920 [Ignavibacteria bacterium GWF2_33_9]